MTRDGRGDGAERRPWTVDDAGIVVAGVVVFALGWLPWYDATLGAGEHVSFRAWDLGPLSALGVLLALYAALRVAWVRRFPLGPEVPLAPGVEPLTASALALVLVLYRALDVPTVPLASTVGPTVWLVAALLGAVFQAAFAVRKVARTGFRA